MNKINVFTDFHHASLLNSLIMLFEKRFGGNVYRPIGTDWYEKGYWKVYDHPATVEQFLGIGGATPDGTSTLNDVVFEQTTHPNKLGPAPGIYHCRDIDSGQTNKAITHAAFMDMRFDCVIASIPQHIPLFRKLCNEHQDHPKLIYQIGNAWNLSLDELLTVDAIMSSAKTNSGNLQQHRPYIEYHQEFDMTIFVPQIPIENNWVDFHYIASFVNCFSIDRLFSDDWALFQIVESMMPNWKFESLGGQCRDGACHGSEELANQMQMTRFIWHTKRGGDGYGHVLHNSAAVARPIIFKKEYYEGKMGEQLMIDGVTGIQIDGLSPEQIKNKIEYYNEPSIYKKLCENVYNNFRTVVDFDQEFQKLKLFIENLV